MWARVMARPRSFFFFQAEDGIRAGTVTGVQTCALPISPPRRRRPPATRSATTGVLVGGRRRRGGGDQPRRRGRRRRGLAPLRDRQRGHQIGRASCRERVRRRMVGGTWERRG